MPSPSQKHQPKSPKAKEDPGLSSKKKNKDKVKWVAAEKAVIIMTLLTQRQLGTHQNLASSHPCGP